jgi:hypothetical protein
MFALTASRCTGEALPAGVERKEMADAHAIT